MSDPEQLDIFAHSRDVMLRNDVLAALERRDARAARGALAGLAAEFPGEPRLAALGTLADALNDALADAAAPPDHAALAERRERLMRQLAPAARQCLGADAAGPWLRPLWAALAARASALPFDPAHPDDHAAALWLAAGRFDDAVRAVQRIPSWRRIPAPLGWMLEARCALGGIDDAWPLVAELAWIAPARLAALLDRIDEPLLRRLHRRFVERFDAGGGADDTAWFPAWVLTDTPALAPRLAAAQPSQHTAPERALRVLVELLGLERQGRQPDIVAHRRTLRALHAGLYAAYMATR